MPTQFTQLPARALMPLTRRATPHPERPTASASTVTTMPPTRPSMAQPKSHYPMLRPASTGASPQHNNLMPALPRAPNPLTRKSLAVWANEEGTSLDERTQRIELMNKILKVATRTLTRRSDANICPSPHLIAEDEALILKGNLDASGFDAITVFPDGLSIIGNFDCSGCTSLKQISRNIDIDGNLQCVGCTSLITLAKEARITGSVSCSNCTIMSYLGDSVTIGGASLDCRHNAKMSRLAFSLHLTGHINMQLSGCNVLICLARKLVVARDLHCPTDVGLRYLARTLEVGGDCVCISTKLKTIADKAFIGGHFDCCDNDELTTLATESVTVNRHVMCSYNENLSTLPKALKTNGSLFLYKCPKITTPPMELSVALSRVCFDCGSSRWWTKNGSHIDFPDIDTAFIFWQRRSAESIFIDFSSWHNMLPREIDEIREYLGRLCNIADNSSQLTRRTLAQRVCHLLQAMNEDDELRRLCQECLGGALTCRPYLPEEDANSSPGCNDSITWALNQTDMAMLMHRAVRSGVGEEALKKLLLSGLRLDLVHKEARKTLNAQIEACKTGVRQTKIDPIEIFLCYETELRESLSLPVLSSKMSFRSSAGVSGDDIKRAYDAVQRAMNDKDQVEKFLLKSGEWQRYQRGKDIKAWCYREVDPLDSTRDRVGDQQNRGKIRAQPATERICPITLQDESCLGACVYLKLESESADIWQPYEFEDLKTYWVQSGTEPLLRRKFNFADLRRPRLSPHPTPQPLPQQAGKRRYDVAAPSDQNATTNKKPRPPNSRAG